MNTLMKWFRFTLLVICIIGGFVWLIRELRRIPIEDVTTAVYLDKELSKCEKSLTRVEILLDFYIKQQARDRQMNANLLEFKQFFQEAPIKLEPLGVDSPEQLAIREQQLEAIRLYLALLRQHVKSSELSGEEKAVFDKAENREFFQKIYRAYF